MSSLTRDSHGFINISLIPLYNGINIDFDKSQRILKNIDVHRVTSGVHCTDDVVQVTFLTLQNIFKMGNHYQI